MKAVAIPPQPLNATPAAKLDWKEDGTPVSDRFDDIYFSVDGGLAETAHVFLKGCGLPDGWEDRRLFTIAELGFGSGLNFLATLDMWQSVAKPEQRLHFISVEAYPWTREQLIRGLAKFPKLAKQVDLLIRQWPGRVKGVHRLHFGTVSLTLFHMPVQEALPTLNACIDAWFLDGFSPAKNPDMWSESTCAHLAKLSNPHASLASFTVAGQVRRNLEQAGFEVSKRPGFGRKRECLEAVYVKGTSQPAPQTVKRTPIIIGGGIAGASLCKAYERRGITPILIDPEPELTTAASGNPRALVAPRLDLQDRPESRFFNTAYLYAVREYAKTNAVRNTGIITLAKSEVEAVRFDKLARQEALPPDHMRLIDQTEAQSVSGHEFTVWHTGLYYEQATLIDPKALIKQWTRTATKIPKRAAHIQYKNQRWSVWDDEGNWVADSEVLYLCAGAQIGSLLQLPIRFTRGQICWGAPKAAPKISVTYGGYAAPYGDEILLGASHAHVEAEHNPQIRHEDTDANIEEFRAVTGRRLEAQGWQSRAAVRVTTKDTLPIAAQHQPGLFVLSGLGSRGFMLAPLLAEALVSEALDEPAPLCANTKVRFGAREKI